MRLPVREPPTATRRVRRAGVLALLAGLAYVLIGLIFFVFPGQDPLPQHATVAFVLGPPTSERMATADGLLSSGKVDYELISLPRPWLDLPEWSSKCAEPRTSCQVAVPNTTQGEARMLASFAAAHPNTSAVVITQTAHLERARTIVQRCFSGPVAMRDSGEPPSRGWPYEFAYQTAATVKAWLHPGC